MGGSDRSALHATCRFVDKSISLSVALSLPRGVTGVDQADDPLQVGKRGELDGDPALALAEVDLDPGLQPVREPGGEVGQRRARSAGCGEPAAGGSEPRSPTATISSRPRTEMPSATTRPASRSWTSASSTAEQGAGVPGREHAGGHPPLHGRGELEQPQRVADLRPAAADPGGQLLVRAAEVVEQLLVGGRLLERVQLGAVQVLQQRVAEQVVVAGLPDDRRDDGRGRPPGWPASGARP